MKALTYKEQLLSPNWQRKRLEIMQRDDFACKCCQDNESTLHVHHKRYVKGRMAWEYPNAELVTLCWSCHSTAHEQGDDFKELLAQLPIDGPGSASNGMAVLAGWANGEQRMDLSRFTGADPFHYAIGEVANRLDCALGMYELLELLDALNAAPQWVIRDSVAGLIKDLRDKAATPKPVGYGEGSI